MSMLKNWMARQPTGVSNLARQTLLSGSVGGQTRSSRVRMSKLQGFGQKPEDRSETAVPSNWPTDASSSAADRPRLRTGKAGSSQNSIGLDDTALSGRSPGRT